MLGFRKNKTHQEANHDTRVQVVIHQQATQEKVNEAKQSNQRLLKALELNHITVKLFVATGGKLKNIHGGIK